MPVAERKEVGIGKLSLIMKAACDNHKADFMQTGYMLNPIVASTIGIMPLLHKQAVRHKKLSSRRVAKTLYIGRAQFIFNGVAQTGLI